MAGVRNPLIAKRKEFLRLMTHLRSEKILKKLSLDGKELSDEEFDKIAELLFQVKNRQTLEDLDLSNNALGMVSIVKLANILERCPNIKKLNLSNVTLGLKAGKPLETLFENRALQNWSMIEINITGTKLLKELENDPIKTQKIFPNLFSAIPKLKTIHAARLAEAKQEVANATLPYAVKKTMEVTLQQLEIKAGHNPQATALKLVSEQKLLSSGHGATFSGSPKTKLAPIVEVDEDLDLEDENYYKSARATAQA